jgi:hypothetical protein
MLLSGWLTQAHTVDAPLAHKVAASNATSEYETRASDGRQIACGPIDQTGLTAL